MSDLNNVSLIGRITCDPEMKVNSNGHSWLALNIANNYYYKNNGEHVEETNFLKVKIWGKYAESVRKYLVNGKQIGIIGRLHQYKFETPEKTNINIVEIIASQVQFLSDSRGGKNNDLKDKMTDD